MRLGIVHWMVAAAFSAAVHLAFFGAHPLPLVTSGESGAGLPAVVWGLAAASVTQEALPVEAGRRVELPVADRTEAPVEPISETAPGPVAAVEAVPEPEERPVEPEPERPAKRPSPAASSGGGPVGQQSGSSAAARSGPSSTGISAYSSRVLSHLQRYKRYPGGGARGTVNMVFVLASNGSVQSVRVTARSGSSLLDEAAVAMVRRASPFPSIPNEIGRTSMTFSVPVRFSP